MDPKTPDFLLSVSDTVVVPAGEEWCWWQCTVKNGREIRDIGAVELAQACGELGAGEILLNNNDCDGAGQVRRSTATN